MAYVPGLEYDVFISYARANDFPRAGSLDTRWITNLRNFLEPRLNERLPQGKAAIWMDTRDLPGNEVLTDEIRAALKETAILLVVFSIASLKSRWCRQEWDWFAEQVGGAASGRIFLVHIEELPLDQRPPAFRDLYGYHFHDKDDDGSDILFGDPSPSKDDLKYYKQLHKLRDELADKLIKLGKAVANPPPQGHTGNGAATMPAPLGAVVVAHVEPGLADERDRIVQELRDRGARALPAKDYPRDLAAFQEALRADLHDCELYVQLLGPFGARASGVQTWDAVQAALACERFGSAPDRLLFWRHPLAKAAVPKYPDHAALLQRSDVLDMDLEKFKTLVVQKLQQLRDRAELQADADNRLVLINAARNDRALAQEIADNFQRRAIDYRIVDERKSLVEVAKSINDNANALVVIYGSTSEDWVADQVWNMRSYLMDRKQQAPLCAVFLGPPPGKPPLSCRFRQLVLIEGQDRAGFDQFLQKVAQP